MHPTAVEDLEPLRKRYANTPMPHRDQDHMPILIDQSSVCNGLYLVIFANSIAQAADFKWHVEVEASPYITLHSCCRLVKGRKGTYQQSNASVAWAGVVKALLQTGYL